MRAKIEDCPVEVKSCVDIVINEEEEAEEGEVRGNKDADDNR